MCLYQNLVVSNYLIGLIEKNDLIVFIFKMKSDNKVMNFIIYLFII